MRVCWRIMKLNLTARFAAAALSVVAIGCADPAEPSPDPVAAAQVGEVQRLPRDLPPPSSEAPRYVGLWATSAEGCNETAWRFAPRAVSTAGEVSCSFYNVTMTDTGYDLEAMCTVEAPAAPYRIQLSFAESARAMMVSGGPWAAPVSLVYCGDHSASD